MYYYIAPRNIVRVANKYIMNASGIRIFKPEF